jgi:hypothetical protein
MLCHKMEICVIYQCENDWDYKKNGSLTNSVEGNIFSNLVHMIVLLDPSRAGHEISIDASLEKDDRWHWGSPLAPGLKSRVTR